MILTVLLKGTRNAPQLRRCAGALVALVLITSGCSGKGESQGRPTPAGSSPSASNTPSPTTTSASPTQSPRPKPVPSARKVVYEFDGDLYLYTVATDSVTRLTSSSAFEYDPKFIDSNRISFLTYQSEPAKAFIYEMRLGTKARKLLLTTSSVGRIMTHAWSPARSTVAYLTLHETAGFALRFFVPSSKSDRSVRNFGKFEGREYGNDDSLHVEWQPDGRAVLVVGTPLESGRTMYVVRGTGANAIAPRAGTFARYAPDGSRIYYREFGGQERWRQVTVPGGAVTAILVARGSYRPSISRDGRSLAFDNGAATPSVYVYSFSARTYRRAGPGFDPLWLTTTTLAVRNAVRCAPTSDDPCFDPYKPTGTVDRLSTTGAAAKRLKMKTTSADVLYQ